MGLVCPLALRFVHLFLISQAVGLVRWPCDKLVWSNRTASNALHSFSAYFEPLQSANTVPAGRAYAPMTIDDNDQIYWGCGQYQSLTFWSDLFRLDTTTWPLQWAVIV